MVETVGPNAALRDFLQRFFADGDQLASLRYHIASQSIEMPLVAFLRGGPTMAPPPLPTDADLGAIFHSEKNDINFLGNVATKYPWDNSAMTSEFIAILCADLEDVEARVRAVAFNSRALGGLPTLTHIRLKAPASLLAALNKAIAVQQGGHAARAIHGGRMLPPSSTCLIVSVTDCAMLKAAEQYNQSIAHYTSYGHQFALLVDTCGVGLYQAWGGGSGPVGITSSSSANAPSTLSTSAPGRGDAATPGHLTLSKWLDRAPLPMSYNQALDFAYTFEAFCERLTWDDLTNGLYNELFGVDMKALGAARGRPPPGRIKSWVRILEVPGVTAERIRANTRFFL